MEKNLKKLIWILGALSLVLIGILIYVLIDRNGMIRDLNIDKTNLTLQTEQLQLQYDSLSTTNDTINSQLALEKEKVAQLVENIEKTKASNRARLRRYERELGTLRSIMKGYIRQIDSLNTLNIHLRKETALARKQAKESDAKYKGLKSTTEELGKKVELGAMIKGRGLNMTGITSRSRETDRSSRVKKIKTCLSLVENSIAQRGPINVYIRIKGPDSILMTSGDQKIFTSGNEQLLYSASREVDYEGSEVEICIFFEPGAKLNKGVYKVEAYTKDGEIASGDMLLK
ncbi:MAG: hypothetical protein LKI53_02815 [Bacteroidales bacterium]|jgi:hypothetical protein|nr:hypothetical protein [Bacteroidales bacterium]